MTIHKYRLEPTGDVLSYWANMPHGSVVLHIGSQDGIYYVWALIDKGAKMRDREFRIYGTGWDLPEPMGTYINTFFDGPYVWHAFEA